MKLDEAELKLINQPLSRKDMVLTLLRAAIIDGRLAAGQRLDQNEIAAKFNVSRMPVREALKQLETEGLVVVYPYRGVEVAALDTEELVELFAIRGALERLAVRRAVENLTAEMPPILESILRQMDKLVGQESGQDEWSKLNREFHDRINLSSEWPRVFDAIATYRDKVERYVRLYFSMQGRAQSQKEHWQLLDAIKERDVAAAQAIIEAHSNGTAAILLDAIEIASSQSAQEEI